MNEAQQLIGQCTITSQYMSIKGVKCKFNNVHVKCTMGFKKENIP